MKIRLLLFLFLALSAFSYGQNCSVTISQSAASLCSGYSVTLGASGSGGTAPYTYVWSTGETSATITVDKAGTYSVTATDKTGCQSKKSVDIASTTTPNAPTATGAIVCLNSSATLTATAPGGTYQWYDAATGGNFLFTGAAYVTPPITQNTIFFVETTIAGCTSPRTAVGVSLAAKPTVQDASACAGDVATLIASGGSSFIWYDAPTGGNKLFQGDTFTTPVLTTNTTYYVSSVSKTGCESARTPATVTVTPKPGAPVAAAVTVCSGSPANLHATGSGSIFSWYSTATGGSPLISSPDYTTPPLTADATYYVADATNGCQSGRTAVKVTVTPAPAAPATQNYTTCYQSSITLQAPPIAGTTYQWYDVPGGTLLTTGNTFTTPVLTNSTTYYLRAGNGGCISTFSPVNVTIAQPPPAPTATGVITCYNTAATLTATSQGGGTFQWYDAATGGRLLFTGPSFTTPPLTALTTYYVQNTQAGCVSARAAVKVSILPFINAPTAAGVSTCSGETATISATGSNGGYAWYSSTTGGTALSTAQAFVTPVLNATTTYYVDATENGCESARIAVKVTVTPTPVAPTVNSVTVCTGMTATLKATGATGTVNWLDAATGGNLLGTGNTFTTPVLNATTTYYAESVSGQCMSTVVPVTVTVNAISQFQYTQNTICAGGPNVTPTLNNPAGGTFSATPAGLVFVSTVTGQINAGASTPGNYTVTYTGKGSCTMPETQTITIATTPNGTFSYATPVCQGSGTEFPLFTGTGSAGSFSASPAGLVFVNTSSGEIDLAKSTPNTYLITNTIAAGGTCPGASSTFSITIAPKANVNAGPDQTVATGTPVQLAGNIGGAASTGTWSGGTGSFSNPNSLTPIYTPGAGETKVTLTLTSADPPGVCGPASSKVTITFTSQTAAPTVQSILNCAGSVATLSATAPGGAYKWYDAPTGGNLLFTGPDFTTPVLSATTTYYVQTTVNGINSARTSATVTVNPVPAAPVAPGQQTCAGTSATLLASGSTGTYEWYDAPVGGNLLSAGATYPTPALIANTTYYVQTTVNGCISTRTPVNVTISPKPAVTSFATGAICSGQPLSYNITANLPNTTFIWSRAQVAGISNPAAVNQTSSTITETLVNTGSAAVSVTYVITPSAGACAGPVFNYVVTVYPTPTVTSPATATICNASTDDYAITFSGPVTSFSWSRAAVPGISNQAVSGQAAGVIKEVLFNSTNQPINVTYAFSYNTPTCTGILFNVVITVNPQDQVTSVAKGTACTDNPQDYVITASIPSSTFVWSRAPVANISNPGVYNQTSGTITETLENTSFTPVNVEYDITPTANGCPGTPFKYIATVNPKLPTTVANSNSPICVGSNIRLSTPPIINATYLWTGPNGYTSTAQNPVISNAQATDAGAYTVVFMIKNCVSTPVTVNVAVDLPPVVSAGPDTSVCISTTSIALAGSVSGGTTTGVWSTSGTGTFSPSASVVNATYIPSPADTTAGSVTLTLTSTSKDNCVVQSDGMKITFSKQPAVEPGVNQVVCSQTTAVQLNGNITIGGGGTWTTSGDGTFSPSATQLNAVYVPGTTDIVKRHVTLTLSANNPGVCFTPADSIRITFLPPPAVYAGGSRFVLVGQSVTLMPTVSENDVHYLWSPNMNINNDTLKNPVITGVNDIVYTLTVTDSLGCVAQDTAFIKVSPVIHINNTFTPNGDGVNDHWDIIGLVAYQDATVDIFDRWGKKIFHSLGYPSPWDGTYNGKPVSVGVYYYIINTHFAGEVFSGSVTVIR